MLTIEEALDVIKHTDSDYFCSSCLYGMIKTKEGTWYCPNEMCLNDTHFEND